MASITILNLDDDVKTRLCTRAASNGHSMEEQARLILRAAVEREAAPENLAAFSERVNHCHGADTSVVSMICPPIGRYSAARSAPSKATNSSSIAPAFVIRSRNVQMVLRSGIGPPKRPAQPALDQKLHPQHHHRVIRRTTGERGVSSSVSDSLTKQTK